MGGTHLTVADVNGDGKPDIITVPSYGAANVRVFLNQYPANPAFQATPDISFQAFPVASIGGAVVAAGDMGRLVNGCSSTRRTAKRKSSLPRAAAPRPPCRCLMSPVRCLHVCRRFSPSPR